MPGPRFARMVQRTEAVAEDRIEYEYECRDGEDECETGVSAKGWGTVLRSLT